MAAARTGGAGAHAGRPGGSRREYWRGIVEDCLQSGLRQAEFCRRRGIAPGTLSFWKFTLAREGTRRPAARPAFVPVRIAPAVDEHGDARTSGPTALTEVEIALSGGRLVRLRGAVDARWLAHVLRTLEASGC